MRKRRKGAEEPEEVRGVGEAEGGSSGGDGAEPASAGGAESPPERPPSPQRRYTAEQKRDLDAAQRLSGQSVREFCETREVSAASLSRWRRELGFSKAVTRRHSRRSFSAEERRAAVEAYERSDRTQADFAKLWGCSLASLSKWRRRYREEGPQGLEPRPMGKRGSRPAARTVSVPVREKIVEVQAQHPDFGLRKIRDFLARFGGAKVSAGTVRSVLTEHGVPALPAPKKRPRRRVKPPRRFERARAGQMWQTDITSYVLARPGRRVYLCAYVDDFSRFIVAWQLAAQQRADLVIDPLLEGMARFGKPEEVLSDQGRQYFAWRGKSRFQKLLAKEGVQHVVSRTHHPQTLGKCERLWKTIFEEFWERAKPTDLTDARERLGHFIGHYNHFRPHQGIEGAVPADRFFGAETSLRETLEKVLSADELHLALDPVPRHPVYLFGQIGTESVSLHGEQGRLVIQTQDGKRREIELDELGVPSSSPDEPQVPETQENDDLRASRPRGTDFTQTQTQTHGPQAHGVSGAQEDCSGGEGPVESGQRGGAAAGARDVRADAGVLAGEEVEGAAGRDLGRAAAEGLAAQPTGRVGHASGPLEAASAQTQLGGAGALATRGGSSTAEEEDRGAGDAAVAHGGLGARAADSSLAAESEPERGEAWSEAQEGESSTISKPANASGHSFAVARTALSRWRRWRRRSDGVSER